MDKNKVEPNQSTIGNEVVITKSAGENVKNEVLNESNNDEAVNKNLEEIKKRKSSSGSASRRVSESIRKQFKLKLGYMIASGKYHKAENYTKYRAEALNRNDKDHVQNADRSWKIHLQQMHSFITKWPPSLFCCNTFWTTGHYPMWSQRVKNLKLVNPNPESGNKDEVWDPNEEDEEVENDAQVEEVRRKSLQYRKMSNFQENLDRTAPIFKYSTEDQAVRTKKSKEIKEILVESGNLSEVTGASRIPKMPMKLSTKVGTKQHKTQNISDPSRGRMEVPPDANESSKKLRKIKNNSDNLEGKSMEEEREGEVIKSLSRKTKKKLDNLDGEMKVDADFERVESHGSVTSDNTKSRRSKKQVLHGKQTSKSKEEGGDEELKSQRQQMNKNFRDSEDITIKEGGKSKSNYLSKSVLPNNARNLSTHRLHITNLSTKATLKDLQELFLGAAVTLNTNSMGKLFATVSYKSEELAYKAFMKNKKAELHGKPLSIAPLVQE